MYPVMRSAKPVEKYCKGFGVSLPYLLVHYCQAQWCSVGPSYGVDRTMGLTPKVRTNFGLKIFNPIVRSDTPGYAPSDRTLGLNPIVRPTPLFGPTVLPIA